MKKLLVTLLMIMPLIASAQSFFTVESNGEKYTFPLEGTTITITESSEDSELPTSEDIKKYIIGMWQATHITGWFYDANDKLTEGDKDITEDDEDYAERVYFKEDGTCTVYVYSTEDKKWVEDINYYKYVISGNNIITYDGEDGEEIINNKILSINSTTFIGEFDPTEGRETGYKAKMTYTKVSK